MRNVAYSNMLTLNARVELLAEKGVLTQEEILERNEKITNRDNGQKEGRLISAWTQRIVADLEKSLQRLSGSPMPPEVLPGVLKLNALREERHLQQSRRHRPQS